MRRRTEAGSSEVGGADGYHLHPVAWYKEWFGEEYLELYAHRDVGEAEGHIDFVERVLGNTSPNAVLDLACGAGRHTAALRRRGYRALGIDLSRTLLAQSPGLPRVAGDMRALPFVKSTFDWVLSFFTSFGYFETEEENFRVLEEVSRVLTPGGRLLLDIFNRDRVLENLRPSDTATINGRPVQIERWYDAESRRVNKRIQLVGPPGTSHTFLESVRAYSADEVVDGMRTAGLTVRETFGGFEAEPFDETSERLIILAANDR